MCPIDLRGLKTRQLIAAELFPSRSVVVDAHVVSDVDFGGRRGLCRKSLETRRGVAMHAGSEWRVLAAAAVPYCRVGTTVASIGV